jgi:hypothetical protein
MKMKTLTLILAGSILISPAHHADPAKAEGTWTTPRTIEEPDQPVHELKITAGPRRFAIAAWISGTPRIVAGGQESVDGPGEVWISVRGKRRSRFNAPRAMSEPGARSLRLKTADNGETVLAWVDERMRLLSRFRTLGGRWSEPHIVAEGVSTALSLDVAPDGSGALGWRSGRSGESDELLHAAIRPPGGAFASPTTLAGPPDIGAFGPVVAAAPRGRALATWSGRCWTEEPASFQRDSAAALIRISPDASHTQSQLLGTIPNTKCPTSDLHSVLRNDGTAIAVVDGLRGASEDALKASVRTPDMTSFPAPTYLSPPGLDAGGARVGLLDSGKVLSVWTATHTGQPRGVYGSILRRNGSFTPPRLISGHRGSLQDAAFNRTGRAVVAWRGFGSSRLGSAVKAKNKSWFNRPEPGPTSLSEGQITMTLNPARRATAVWSRPQSRSSPRGVLAAERTL